MRFLALYICLTSLVGYIAAEIDPIIVKGTHLFYKTNGTAFFARGIVYAPFNLDPTDAYASTLDSLADGAACRRDIPYLSSLGANVVIITGIDHDRDHKECMNAFADAGIYALVKLFDDPKVPYYDQDASSLRASMIDSIAEFPNLLGLRIIVDENDPPASMPFYRAATRDMRAYMAKKKYRNIPVFFTLLSEPTGFPDISDRAPNDNIDYFWCHDDAPDVLAFWTQHPDGPSACWTREGVRSAVSFFEDYSIPMIYDKIYCQWNRTGDDDRTFDFISEAYTSNAKEVLSGSLVARYYDVTKDNITISLVDMDLNSSELESSEDVDVKPFPGFSALSSEFAKATPTFANAKDHNPTIVPRSCPSNSPWNFPDVLPQRPYEPLCSCMVSEVKCRAKSDAFKDKNLASFQSTVAKLCNQMPADDCVGIEANSSVGNFGGFSSCNRTTVYSWVADRYYARFGECDNNGTLELVNQTLPRSDNCSFLLDQVGKNGEKQLKTLLDADIEPDVQQPGSNTTDSQHSNPGGADTANSGSSKMSVGAWVGVGVGILVAVLLLSIAGCLLLRQKKKRKAESEMAMRKDLPEVAQTGDISNSSSPVKSLPDELPELMGDTRHELMGISRPPELMGAPRSELMGVTRHEM